MAKTKEVSQWLRIVERTVLPALTPEEVARIHFFFPEELQAFLEELAGTPEEKPKTLKEETQFILGYKVHTTWRQLSPEELKMRNDAIARTIAHSILEKQRKAAAEAANK